MTKAKPKRRWFRFSLRTMFVIVTLICIALGSWLIQRQRSIVRQRAEFITKLLEDDKDPKVVWNTGAQSFDSTQLERRLFGDAEFVTKWLEVDKDSKVIWKTGVPSFDSMQLERRLFGDKEVSRIVLPRNYSQVQVEKALALFPEARIEQWREISRNTNGRWLTTVNVRQK